MADGDFHKELELIQQVIERQATNSFNIKAWAITVIVGALVFRTNNLELLIAIIPLLGFWLLDGYFLLNERRYRELYQEVIKDPGAEDRTMFNMDASNYLTSRRDYLEATFLSVVGVFYILIGVAVGIYAIIIMS